LLFIAVIFSSLLLPIEDEAQEKTRLTEVDVKAIRETVEGIRAAIVSVNIDVLLEYISKREGLSCTDTGYTYANARSFLKNSHSIFYESLFDSTSFRKQCGSGYPIEYPAISEREFFTGASHDILIEATDKNWVKITIRSPIKSHYERGLYLHREGHAWKVAGDSFVIGNCGCG
jgi:hypothetical protein